MTTTKATRDVIDLATRPITNLQCTGGNIDGTVIGNTTPAVGKFSNLFGNNITVNASGTLDVSASGVTIIGTIHAYYAADIAEDYYSDAEYPAGTVVVWGGSEEITIATQEMQHNLAGVISTEPSYQLNSKPTTDGRIKRPLAMVGRVPVRVAGPHRMHDLLVLSSIPGVAMSLHASAFTTGPIVGRVLSASEDYNEHLVEAVVQYHIG